MSETPTAFIGRRERSRLEVDDPDFCKWCGADRTLGSDGLCGECFADKLLYGMARGDI